MSFVPVCPLISLGNAFKVTHVVITIQSTAKEKATPFDLPVHIESAAHSLKGLVLLAGPFVCGGPSGYGHVDGSTAPLTALQTWPRLGVPLFVQSAFAFTSIRSDQTHIFVPWPSDVAAQRCAACQHE